ncbi:hypothetical protein G6F43_012470 [Rhizopus delemar]|nr:hypothetical protein G6F43_012470 [Rhizopus delemar]
MIQEKNIVIVGGGFAGVETANVLEKELTRSNDSQYRIILIEKKTHFYHAIAGLRSAVIDWDQQILVPYTNLFKSDKHRVIQASAVQFEKNHIVLDREVQGFGSSIPFDYLILATGTKRHPPAQSLATDIEDIRNDLHQTRKRIQSAKSILIVGGGPVGFELTGEIRDAYEDKEITLIHSNNRLFSSSTTNVKLSERGLALLQKNNVKVILNDRIETSPGHDPKGSMYQPEQGIVKTKLGKTLTGIDLVLVAFGDRPQTEWLKNSTIGNSILSESGYIKVRPTFQVDHPELSHVFVIGDAADFSETKHGYRIKDHVPPLVKNLLQLALLNDDKLKGRYKKKYDAMMVTFGKKQGVGLLPLFGGIVVESWVVGRLKSGTLFYKMVWENLNLEPPVVRS